MKRILEADNTVKIAPANTSKKLKPHDRLSRPAPVETVNNLSESNSESISFKDFENSIVNSMTDGLLVLDKDLKITLINQAFSELTGFDGGELIGQPIKTFLCDDQISILKNFEE